MNRNAINTRSKEAIALDADKTASATSFNGMVSKMTRNLVPHYALVNPLESDMFLTVSEIYYCQKKRGSFISPLVHHGLRTDPSVGLKACPAYNINLIRGLKLDVTKLSPGFGCSGLPNPLVMQIRHRTRL